MELTELTAVEAARQIGAGELTSEALVGACLARIDAIEETCGAWVYLDGDYALAQARACDEERQTERPVGPLHGIPVGIKDIIDTHDMPCECGTPLYAGRTTNADAAVVAWLREAGAVIIGKTVTTELAAFHPNKTTNPHDPTRTPGGSSSGSAAAVAAGMVPLAVGSQTNGSVIRPAAYCGVYGLKPTFGRISRHGVLMLSAPVDTLGVIARTVEDAALIADVVMRYDARDSAMQPRGGGALSRVAASEPPIAPNFAFVKSPVWDHAEDDVVDGFGELAEFLGESCDAVDLPEPFDHAVDWHRTLMVADMAKNFAPLYERGKEQLSATMRAMIEAGQEVRATDYNAAFDRIAVLRAGLGEVFERYDAIITPAATGEAPPLETTGSPIFCTLWTYCGLPAITVPLLTGRNGLPIGVQLVGPNGDDARLLRTARWLVGHVAARSTT